MFDNTQEWKEYQQGIDYNTKINYYANTELGWNFYNNKQWIGIVTNGLSKWTFNICKSAINYFIGFIMSQKVKMQYSAENLPDEPTNDKEIQLKQLVDLMSNMAEMKWEKDKMDSKLRQLMLDGAVTGDFYTYVYWDDKKETGQLEKGDFTTEIVDGVNVLFGNPNNQNVEAQPYILIVRRQEVKDLKRIAKENGIEKALIDTITADQDNQYQAGAYGKIELDTTNENGKATSIIKLWKKDRQVYWNESTKTCPIRKEVPLGISLYPIAKGNWETVKNCYRGMSAIEGIIDNQISINQMFAMISYWMKMNAYGKTIIDSTKITSWSNKLGEVIKASGDLAGAVYQLQAGNFNIAILKVIELAIQYTKEFIGASDALMGQINPEQASGTAIISTAKQASTPLGNITANRDQFVEDLGLIWGEFFLKKYKNRTVSYREDDKVVTAPYSTEGLAEVLLQCKVDVGPSTFYSEIQGIQSLDNLLKQGTITPLQYFERMSKMNVIPDCQGLIKDLEAQQEAEAQLQQQEEQANASGNEARFEQMAQYLESLPQEEQQRIMMLPPEQQEQAIMESIQGGKEEAIKQEVYGEVGKAIEQINNQLIKQEQEIQKLQEELKQSKKGTKINRDNQGNIIGIE